jgi:hypothetical protein
VLFQFFNGEGQLRFSQFIGEYLYFFGDGLGEVHGVPAQVFILLVAALAVYEGGGSFRVDRLRTAHLL